MSKKYKLSKIKVVGPVAMKDTKGKVTELLHHLLNAILVVTVRTYVLGVFQ